MSTTEQTAGQGSLGPRLTSENESDLARTRRARRTNRALAEAFPDAHCELDFANPFELLVATVLSAQTGCRASRSTPMSAASQSACVGRATLTRFESNEF